MKLERVLEMKIINFEIFYNMQSTCVFVASRHVLKHFQMTHIPLRQLADCNSFEITSFCNRI